MGNIKHSKLVKKYNKLKIEFNNYISLIWNLKDKYNPDEPFNYKNYFKIKDVSHILIKLSGNLKCLKYKIKEAQKDYESYKRQ